MRNARIEDADTLQQAREAAMSGATSVDNPIPLTIDLDDKPSTTPVAQ